MRTWKLVLAELIGILIGFALLVLVLSGCGEYRPSIIDIRDEPTPIVWSPRQPEKFARTILEFKP